MRELRPYQIMALDALRSTIGGGVRRVVLAMPTGSGKTMLAASAAHGALSKNKKVAFVVPALSLIDQAIEDFAAEGITDVGVIQAHHHMEDWSKPIQICSVQTLARRRVPDVDVVFIDECHRLHVTHKEWMGKFAKNDQGIWMWSGNEQWRNVPFIGLSATPWTKGLRRYFETLLVAETTQGLIDAGYLSRFRVFATGHPDLSHVRTVAGDFHEGDLSGVMQQGTLTADIIQTWQERCAHHDKTLCFAVDRLHAKGLQERFEFAGIRCGYQDAETPIGVRKDIKNKFHSGEYQVVVNIGTLTTGVDWDVRCLVLARPTKSEILFAQIIGRALRTAKGKEHALILDHSDTTSRLGFVTDIFHDELDNGEPRKKVERKDPLPVACEACDYLMPRRMLICPNCGHQIELPKNSRVERDGVLYEMERDGSMLKAAKIPAHQWTRVEREQFFSELLAYANQRNFKKGWASNQYRTKFGDYPPRNFEFIRPAAVISPTVYSWIRSRMIAWAKGRARETA